MHAAAGWVMGGWERKEGERMLGERVWEGEWGGRGREGEDTGIGRYDSAAST